VNQINPLVKGLFDVLASELQSCLLTGHIGDASVSWGDDITDPGSSDLIWWSWSLSIDAGCRVLAGAPMEVWREVCGLDPEVTPAEFDAGSLAILTPVIQEAARSRFGSEVTCAAAERSEGPAGEWTSGNFIIKPASGDGMPINFSISNDLQAALGGSPSDKSEPEAQESTPLPPAARSSADILMHVEMPVTIVLGRTKMRLKDLLRLTTGSVVELDQMLDDEVEVRVNNCVIAYGEVVAVNSNYAVRILRMAPPRSAPNLRGRLPEKAA